MSNLISCERGFVCTSFLLCSVLTIINIMHDFCAIYQLLCATVLCKQAD